MARVLVVHGNRGSRKFLVARVEVHHEAKSVDNLARAMKAIKSFQPNVVIAELDGKRTEAFDLLRYLRRSRIDLPVVLCGAAGAGMLQPMAMKYGAIGFLEYPMEQEPLDRILSKALQNDKYSHRSAPPISREELAANLSDLEQRLNRQMVCFAGKNQVYLQAIILGNGQTTKPRIALKCSLRKRYGHPPDVYYEYIRDVCCSDPSVCPAYQEFNTRRPC